MSTNRTVRPEGLQAQVPMLPSAEPTLVRLQDRQQDLSQHEPSGPNGLRIAATGLSRAARLANGHTANVRCHQQTRYRLMQLDGSKAFPYEEAVAMGEESALGREVAVEMFRVPLEAWGFRLVPVDVSSVQDRRRAAIGAVTAFSRTTQEVVTALEDGQIDDIEEQQIDQEMEEVTRRVEHWKAAKAARGSR